MSGFKKFLLIIISLLGITILLAFASTILSISYVSDWTKYLLALHRWVPYIVLGLLGIIIVFFVILLLLAISAERPIEYLDLKTETGSIKITKAAVLSALFQSLLDIPECRQANIGLKVHRRKTEVSITISCSVSDLTLIHELGLAIQQRVTESLATTVGIPARSINVKIKENKTNKTDPVV